MAETTNIQREHAQPDRKNAQLRVLVIDEELPWPLNSGKRIRTWNLISRLARSHAIDWLCFGPVSDEARAAASAAGIEVQALPPIGADQGVILAWRLVAHLFTNLPYSAFKHRRRDMKKAIREGCNRRHYDLVHIEWSPYATYVDAIPTGIGTIAVAHNVESQIWERRAALASNPISRAFFRLQARRMSSFERRRLKDVDLIIAVSDSDADTISSWGARTKVVSNGVDLDFYRDIRPIRNNDTELLFLASLDWFPNIDALRFFTSDIFPLVRRSRPEARLRVVGRKLPQSETARLSNVPGVDVVGEVDDVRDELGRASIVVVPLRIGGGSRLKILEAMAAGKPVVSTTIGAEGLQISDGENIRLADTPRAFAAAVIELLDSPDARKALAGHARELVRTHYGWQALSRQLEAQWLSLERRP